MRTRRETVVFKHPFRIAGVDHLVPAGAYTVVTDEEMIEGLSFAAFRRVATSIAVPAASPNSSAMETVTISPLDLAEARRVDKLPDFMWSMNMSEKMRERVSVSLPEVVQAFGAFQKTLLETLITSDAISVAGAKQVFQKTKDNLLNVDAKGAAAVLELMQEQINWDQFGFSPTVVRHRSSP